jgi:hypothetical protein
VLDTTDVEGTLFDLRCRSTVSFLIHDGAIQAMLLQAIRLQTMEPGVLYPAHQVPCGRNYHLKASR